MIGAYPKPYSRMKNVAACLRVPGLLHAGSPVCVRLIIRAACGQCDREPPRPAYCMGGSLGDPLCGCPKNHRMRSGPLSVGMTADVGEIVKKSPAALLALPLVATMLLVGCGGDSKPDASPSSTAISSSTATSAPTTASDTRTITASEQPTTDPTIPAAARAHTPAGAEAFVKYFYSQLNIAWSKPEAGLISRLSATTCKTCTNFEREAAKSVANYERVIGESISLTTVETSDATDPARMTVLAIGFQPESVVVDAKGKTVQTLQRERVRNVVTLQWGASGWRLEEIQSVA